ncbi:hypothetical protein MJO28_014302 [Puccinia striiformis f. sp. tritici]|uniref:OPT family small oligopeptide transporter n=3 Tax=Puccinia striiformis TaxID=27350 RepID=A0A2S4VYN6_9BASI|nr:hypothetical protein Pst134EA_026760 [Puccinia striiformis f. sp. tritici]POW14598.1 hypothetical protein PSTT_02760 [Puccinia striiformis]KAH9450047.1 hypothetical protein Pst134EA_026760 [Puccinia striiformis f. sp. tritici]KAI7938723.1 hypothetical protein MJO28_014302 [Puccinia striiformis f. sp. tritici]KAI7939435.1 hypothetical protein MJO29_014171 [Puccinia striiformis f. sp. tritici]POW19897.1 hypothetical protein PSHT_04067 [Puccinia striiformis]
MGTPSKTADKDVSWREDSQPSDEPAPVALSHEPKALCQPRSMFTYEDDLITHTRNSKGCPISLIDDLENKKEVDGADEKAPSYAKSADFKRTPTELPIPRNENQSDPFDEMADLNCDIRDDGGERTITVRSILIGVLASILGAAIAEVFMFKPVHVHVDVLFLQIICLIMGHFSASVPGPLWWNPGPIDTKETVFSVIMAASASAGVLGVEVIAAQEVMFEKHMPAIVSLMTLLSSQLIGYGIAGMLRPILVYPTKIVYPGVLPIVALFRSMSGQSETTVKQVSFFKKAMAGISLYEILPTYLAPALSAMSIWCLALPQVPAITNLFGGSLPAEGMGLMAFSGDWTFVGSHSPLFVPLLAQMTDWLAYFGCIIIYSGAYKANWFNGGHLPFISYNIFDKFGNRYNLSAAVMKNGTGNAHVIEELGPPSFSTSFILSKSFLCMAASASVTIGVYNSVVSYREDQKQIKLHGKISKPCPHREITKKMRDLPTYGYAAILVGATALAFLSSYLADSGLAPKALATSLLISFVLCLASGYFYGTLGIHLLVAPVTQMLGGIIFPGNAIGTMWFTMYGSTSVHQCVLMLKDFKLGTYMHLAPISVLTAQLIGTITGGIVHVMVMMSIITSQREVLLMPNGNGIFTGMHLSVIASQSTGWGLFSRAIYYPGKIYAIVPYSLIIGFFTPIPFIIFNKYYPNSVLAKVNISLFIAGLSHGMFGANSGRFTAMIVGFVSQFFMRKYHFKWYTKYNYILCAALDGGTQMTVVLLGFLLQGGAGFELKVPTYFLNPKGTRDYCKLFTANSAH